MKTNQLTWQRVPRMLSMTLILLGVALLGLLTSISKVYASVYTFGTMNIPAEDMVGTAINFFGLFEGPVVLIGGLSIGMFLVGAVISLISRMR